MNSILRRDVIVKRSLYEGFGEEYILSEEEKRIMVKHKEFEKKVLNLNPFFKNLYLWNIGEEESVLTDIFNQEYKDSINVDEIYQVVKEFIDEIVSSETDWDY